MQSPQNLTPRVTADGSFTLFSEEFGECFHSHSGAHQEAMGKFVVPTQLARNAHNSHLCILDICYGLGYNTAAALETIWRVNPDCQVEVVALEADVAVPKMAIAQGYLELWPDPIQQALMQLAQTREVQNSQLRAQLLVGDARQTIQGVRARNFQAAAIFLDPFSPPKCPQLWTVEFFEQVSHCLHPLGGLATYSCAAAVRAGLRAVGLQVGASAPVGRRSPGTVARWTAEDLLPLSPQEVEHLQTRAAVPYRDCTLDTTAADIWAQRQQEQLTSPLEPTRLWKQRWLECTT